MLSLKPGSSRHAHSAPLHSPQLHLLRRPVPIDPLAPHLDARPDIHRRRRAILDTREAPALGPPQRTTLASLPALVKRCKLDEEQRAERTMHDDARMALKRARPGLVVVDPVGVEG